MFPPGIAAKICTLTLRRKPAFSNNLFEYKTTASAQAEQMDNMTRTVLTVCSLTITTAQSNSNTSGGKTKKHSM